jgi:hypothetical protein
MDDVTPNVAVVLFADSQGNERRIDFLDRPYGLDAKDAREMAIPVEFVRKKDRDERVEFLVLHPVLCMESRICNTVGLPKYQGPHGLQQARASVICAQEFLRRDLLDAGERDAVLHLNERIFRFATKHKSGRESAVAFGIEPFNAVLVDERLPEKFRTIRFPQMETQVARQRDSQIQQRIALGPRREKEWEALVRAELPRVHARTARIEARAQAALERHQASGEPSARSSEHARRLEQLGKRVERLHELAAEPTGRPSATGLGLAELLAERKQPDLVREVRLNRAFLEEERSAEPHRRIERQLLAAARVAEPARADRSKVPRAAVLNRPSLGNEGQRATLEEAREATVKCTVELSPQATLDDKQRAAQGEKLEAQWNTIVAKELAAVRSRAAVIGERVGKDVQELRQRMAEHREIAPQKPNAIAGLMGGHARYEAARDTWSKEHKVLQNRESQLEKRAAYVNEYAREPVAWCPTKGTQLAQRKAERREPGLARQVAEYRGWRQGRERERLSREIEQQREREHERGKWGFER